MLQKIKGFIGKCRKKAVAVLTGAFATCGVLAVSAFAAEGETPTSTGNNISEIISSAGSSLSQEFSNLVTALVPVLIGIAMVGLGLYAVIYLFKMAKKFFAHAAA